MTILDFKIKNEYERGKEFSEVEKEWQGAIIVYDNGWIEGIVKDQNPRHNQQSQFVFGTLNEFGYKIYKFVAPDVADQMRFSGEFFEETGYKGKAIIIGILGETDRGSSKLESNENKDLEIEQLQEMIKACKKDIAPNLLEYYASVKKTEEKVLERVRKQAS